MKYVLYIGCILLLYACNENEKGISIEADRFVARNDLGMVQRNGYGLKYDQNTCQIVTNEARKMVRIQTDNQSAYVNMKFAVLPFDLTDLQMPVDVTLTYSFSPLTSATTVTLSMLILKVQNKQVWLWNEEQKTGIIVAF